MPGLVRDAGFVTRNRFRHGIGDRPSPMVGPAPVRLPPAGIDLEKLDAGRHLGSVSNHASQYPVERRAHRHISEMADDEILENAGPISIAVFHLPVNSARTKRSPR